MCVGGRTQNLTKQIQSGRIVNFIKVNILFPSMKHDYNKQNIVMHNVLRANKAGGRQTKPTKGVSIASSHAVGRVRKVLTETENPDPCGVLYYICMREI